MALLSTRTERFEIEMTAQIEGFKDNGNSLIFIIILIFYGQFCISFVPCSMFSLCWVGFFLPEVCFFFFFLNLCSYNRVTAFSQSSFKSHTAKGCHKKSN